MKKIIVALFVLSVITLVSCAKEEIDYEEITQDDLPSMSEDEIDGYLQYTREKFNAKPLDEKIDYVNNGYMSSCYEVEEFCVENPNIRGCMEYCDE